MEVPQSEVLKFYDSFYAQGDFVYYPHATSRRILGGLLRRCRVGSGARILDVGCGTGYYSGIFLSLGHRPTGIDISPVAVEKARAQHPGVAFEVADATRPPFDDGAFDVVFALGVSVANTPDMAEAQRFIAGLMRVVAPGGWLLFLGESTLTGRQARMSNWYNHTWEEIRRFAPEGSWKVEGPFLTHFRLMEFFAPAITLNRAVTLLLRLPFFGIERRVVCLFRKDLGSGDAG